MRALLPPSDPGRSVDLVAHYAYPEERTSPFVRVNFVSSADGAATADGRTADLSSAADREVFGLLRELADVVLVGAGTVRAEDYRGARKPTRGRAAPPPIAVVTGTAELDPRAKLLTDTRVAPIVLTGPDAERDRRDELAAAGADVVVLDPLSPRAIVDELGRRGLRRVLCEGGPRLFGDLLAADLVDELCLTLMPVLTSGDAGRIAVGPPGSPARALHLAGVVEADGALLLRYARSGESA